MESQDPSDLIDFIVSGGIGLAALVYLSRLIERLIKSVENYANLERIELADRLKQLNLKVDRLLVNQERIIISIHRNQLSSYKPIKDDSFDE